MAAQASLKLKATHTIGATYNCHLTPDDNNFDLESLKGIIKLDYLKELWITGNPINKLHGGYAQFLDFLCAMERVPVVRIPLSAIKNITISKRCHY